MSHISCKLYLPPQYYHKLSDEGQALFDYEETSGLFYTSFPADTCQCDCLYEYIIAFVEVSLIMTNRTYALTEETTLQCEVFKLSKSKTLFTLLIQITYPNSEEYHHDFMTFEILKQTAHHFEFKLLGDQTLFSLESPSSAPPLYL